MAAAPRFSLGVPVVREVDEANMKRSEPSCRFGSLR
jgi:hypothetical protein